MVILFVVEAARKFASAKNNAKCSCGNVLRLPVPGTKSMYMRLLQTRSLILMGNPRQRVRIFKSRQVLKKPPWTRSGLAASTLKDQNQELTVTSYASLLNAAGGLPLSIQENFSY